MFIFHTLVVCHKAWIGYFVFGGLNVQGYLYTYLNFQITTRAKILGFHTRGRGQNREGLVPQSGQIPIGASHVLTFKGPCSSGTLMVTPEAYKPWVGGFSNWCGIRVSLGVNHHKGKNSGVPHSGTRTKPWGTGSPKRTNTDLCESCTHIKRAM